MIFAAIPFQQRAFIRRVFQFDVVGKYAPNHKSLHSMPMNTSACRISKIQIKIPFELIKLIPEVEFQISHVRYGTLKYRS